MSKRPHDALFKRAFEQPAQLAALCREQLAPELAQAIAWDSAQQLPGSFIDPKLADFHADLLFEVELAGQPGYLYVLVEHQSSNDALMALRVLNYMVQIWMRHADERGPPLPPLICVVVSNTPQGWRAAQTLHDLVAPSPDLIPGLAELVPNVRFIVDDLSQHGDEQLRARALAAFSRLALWLLKTGRSGPHLLASMQGWVPVIEDLLEAPSGAAALAHLLRYVALVTGDLT